MPKFESFLRYPYVLTRDPEPDSSSVAAHMLQSSLTVDYKTAPEWLVNIVQLYCKAWLFSSFVDPRITSAGLPANDDFSYIYGLYRQYENVDMAIDNPEYFREPIVERNEFLAAFGGQKTPQLLIDAYMHGIYPCSSPGEKEESWWIEGRRLVLRPEEYVCPKSLRRTIKSGKFEVKVDTCFEDVVRACGSQNRIGQWIDEDIVQSYTALHRLGLAHSYETFLNGKLVGGLYGVVLGDIFCGESMFHTENDAAKVAFSKLVEQCLLRGITMIDAQQESPHIIAWGGRTISQAMFSEQMAWSAAHFLRATVERQSRPEQWKSNHVVLLIGGNEGNRVDLLSKARQEINKRVGKIVQQSRIYETAPWGFSAETNFLNQALVCETSLTPIEVLYHTQAIEAQLGRVRHLEQPAGSDSTSSETSPRAENSPHNSQRAYSSRTMDIDIMFYDNVQINKTELQIPHPRLHLRKFALVPLCEIIPNYVHPQLKERLKALLYTCPDDSSVTEFCE